MTIQEQIEKLQQDIKNANELFNVQLKALEEQLKKEQERKTYVPKIGEVYFTISWGRTEVFEDKWENNPIEHKALKMGNIFPTKEECEWEIQHRIVATELKNYVSEHDPRPIAEEDWKNRDLSKYRLIYMYKLKHIDSVSDYTYKVANQVYASNEDVLKNAVEHIGEYRLKKYYFGVEE